MSVPARAEPGRQDLLRMGELAEASGVPAGTIKHYLREGLLPEPIKTSRNMAYYSLEFVDRIKLIKRLQEERFMPLKKIREVLADNPRRVQAIIDLEDRIVARAVRDKTAERITREQLKERFEIEDDALKALEEIGVISPETAGYGADDLQIIDAIARFRKSGYEETLGFTVYDALIYKKHLEKMVKEEIAVMRERMAGKVSEREAAELIEQGVEPLRDFIIALHAKLFVAELGRSTSG